MTTPRKESFGPIGKKILECVKEKTKEHNDISLQEVMELVNNRSK